MSKDPTFPHSIGDWKRKGAKTGGRNDAGPLGGVYEHSTLTALIKKDIHVEKVIGEYVAGKIFQAFAPEHSPRIEFIRTTGNALDTTGNDTYIASVFLPDFQDLFIHLHLKERPMFVGSKTAISKILGQENPFQKFMNQAKQNPEQRTDFAKIMALSLLVRNFDVHTGNVGIVDGKKLVRIDFGGALKGLTDDKNDVVNPEAFHSPLKGATNHFVEYDLALRNSQEMCDSIMEYTNPDALGIMTATVEAAINEVAEYYDVEPIRQFAKRVGMNPKNETDKNTLVSTVTKFLTDHLTNRQNSFRDFGCEIALDLALAKTKGTPPLALKDNQEFKDFFNANRDYFLKLMNNADLVHIRDLANKLAKKEVQKLVAEIFTLLDVFEEKGKVGKATHIYDKSTTPASIRFELNNFTGNINSKYLGTNENGVHIFSRAFTVENNKITFIDDKKDTNIAFIEPKIIITSPLSSVNTPVASQPQKLLTID